MVSDRGDRRRNWWIIAFVAFVAVAAGATVGGLVVSSQSSSASPTVTLVPANSPGADPFTRPVTVGQTTGNVGTMSAQVRRGLRTDPHTKTLVAAGTAPGLYGGSGDVHVCDPQKLVTFLHANPAKARAWASVFHIAPGEIASYVATLTPVVLTADALVTNHGYRNGVATSLQSVLQAGTAVMVDSTGTLRVKCNCGNPLLAPVPINLSSATLLGTRWTGYAPVNVTIVEAGTTVNNFTLVNIQTGATYVQTAGSDTGAAAGGQWIAAEVTYSGGTPQTTVLTSSDGTSWTSTTVVPGEAFSGLAWGDGKWIAVSNVFTIGTATHILQSTDLHTWTQVTTTPETLIAVSHTNGLWVAVGSWPAGVAVAGVDHATRAVYTSTDGTTWTRVDNVPDGPDTGANMRGLVSVAHGDNGWSAAGIDETTPASGAPPSYRLTTLTSSDGTTWNQVGTGVAVGDGRTAAANGGGTWAESMYQTAGKGVLSTGPDGTSWSLVPNTPFATHPVTAIAYGGGTWVAVSGPVPSTDGSPPANPTSTFFSSRNLKSWKQTSQDVNDVTAIAYGGAATGSTTPAPAAGQPPCTRQALQNAFSHNPLDDRNTAVLNSHDPPLCADGWAAVHVPDQGMYDLVVFRANGSTWTLAPADLSTTYPPDPLPADTQAYVARWHALCTDPQFPKALHAYACPGQ